MVVGPNGARHAANAANAAAALFNFRTTWKKQLPKLEHGQNRNGRCSAPVNWTRTESSASRYLLLDLHQLLLQLLVSMGAFVCRQTALAKTLWLCARMGALVPG